MDSLIDNSPRTPPCARYSSVRGRDDLTVDIMKRGSDVSGATSIFV